MKLNSKKYFPVILFYLFLGNLKSQSITRDTILVEYVKDSVVYILNSDSSILHYYFKNEEIWHLKKWYSNGMLENEIDFIDGIKCRSIGWYKSGHIKWIIRYNQNGKINGKQISFYKNGRIKSEQNYINGFESGMWKDWDSTGNIRREVEFNYNTNYISECQDINVLIESKEDEETGEIFESFMTLCLPYNGVYKEYSETGSVIIQGEYLLGEKNNIWKYWNEKGNLIQEEFYEKGKLVKTQEYYKDPH